MIDYLDLGSLRLHEDTTHGLTGIDGLTGPSGVRGTWDDRPEADGWVSPAVTYLPGRTIILEGAVWGGSGATTAAKIDAAWTEWNELAAALEQAAADPTLLKWRHAGGSVDLQGYVQLAGEVLPRLSEDRNGPLVEYQAMLRASDPRWYSQTEQSSTVGSPTVDGGMPLPVVFPIPFGAGSSGGSLTVTNAGNTISYPRLVIQGPISGPVVENVTQGLALVFSDLVVGAGQTLTIETNPASPRSATVAGANALGSLDWLLSEWFGITAGATETIRFYGLGGGYAAGTTLTVYWRDAYLS